MFREYYSKMRYGPQNVASVEILFPTQKQKYINSVGAPMKATIDRGGGLSNILVDMLVEWLVHSRNDDNDEAFTSRYGKRRKLLLQKHVRVELKKTAEELGIDPKRIGNHSLRRGYATVRELNGDFGEAARARAGWCAGSLVPYRHYIMSVNDGGGLSQAKHVSTDTLRRAKGWEEN